MMMKTFTFNDLVRFPLHFKMKIIKLVVLLVVVSSSCQHSAAAKQELPTAQKRPFGHRYTSSHPENCFYPQPSSSQHHSVPETDQRPSTSHFQASLSSCQLQSPEENGSEAKSETKPVDWERSWPTRVELGSISFRGEQGTMAETASVGSSEAQEDSTFSAYDNLHSLSFCQSKEDVSGEYVEALEPAAPAGTPEEVDKLGEGVDSSSSWSSCEILPFDEEADSNATACVAAPPRRRQRLHANGESSRNEEDCEKKSHGDNDDEENDEDEHVYYPASPASCSVSPLSTGSSDVFLPAGSPEHQGPESPVQTSNTHSMLAELKQQMASQRAEYQARIQR